MYSLHIFKGKKGLYSNIWKLYLLRFFLNLYFLGPVFLAFYLEAGLGFKYLMIAQAWYSFWIFLLEIPSGIIADCFGRKKTLIVATILKGIAVYVYAITQNFFVFLVAEFLWALAFVLFSGTDEALAYDTLKDINETYRSKKVFAVMESFAIFGILVATPLGGIIASYLSAKAVMQILIFPCLIAFVVSISLKEAEIKNPVNWDYYAHHFKYELYSLKENRSLKKLIVNLVALYALTCPIIWIYQNIFTKLGVSIFYMGFVYSGWWLLAIILMNNFDLFEKLFYSKKTFLVVSGLFVALMYFTLAFSDSLILIIIFVILGAAFGFARKPLLLDYLNYYIPSYKRATILSCVSMLISFFTAILEYLIGFFSEYSQMVLFVTMGLLALGFTFFSKIREHELIG